MADNFQITYGIGTPASIERFILFALSPGVEPGEMIDVTLYQRDLAGSLFARNLAPSLLQRQLDGTMRDRDIGSGLHQRDLSGTLGDK